jgi:hypothetical protein
VATNVQLLERSELPQAAALIARVYERPLAPDGVEQLEWLLNDNPDASTGVAAGWIVRKDDRVVGLLANVPRRMAVGTREFLAACTAHFVVEPEHRFHGLLLAKAYFEQKNVDALLCSTANEGSGKVLERLGMMPIAGGQAAAVFVLRAGPVVAEVMRRRGHGSLVTAAVAAGAGGAVGVIERVRHRWPAVARGFRVESIEHFDQRVDELWTRRGNEPRVWSVRDARRLNWLFCAGPASRPATRILAAFEGDQMQGYLVTQDPVRMQSMRRREVMDVFVPGDRPEVFATLIGEAGRIARRDGMDTLELRNLPGTMLAQVAEWGARSRELDVNPFLVKTLADDLLLRPERAENWHLVPSDGDGVGW